MAENGKTFNYNLRPGTAAFQQRYGSVAQPGSLDRVFRNRQSPQSRTKINTGEPPRTKVIPITDGVYFFVEDHIPGQPQRPEAAQVVRSLQDVQTKKASITRPRRERSLPPYISDKLRQARGLSRKIEQAIREGRDNPEARRKLEEIKAFLLHAGIEWKPIGATNGTIRR